MSLSLLSTPCLGFKTNEGRTYRDEGSRFFKSGYIFLNSNKKIEKKTFK